MGRAPSSHRLPTLSIHGFLHPLGPHVTDRLIISYPCDRISRVHHGESLFCNGANYEHDNTTHSAIYGILGPVISDYQVPIALNGAQTMFVSFFYCPLPTALEAQREGGGVASTMHHVSCDKARLATLP